MKPVRSGRPAKGETGATFANATKENRFVETDERRHEMVTILVVILVLALIGALPTWPYSRGWGYYPSGGVGLIVLILLILLLLGRI